MPYDLAADMPRLHKVVDVAPSIFNQRPWELVQDGKDRVDLYSVPDPVLGGLLPREVAISCGAALYNLRLAFRVIGRTPSVTLLPDLDRDLNQLTTITAAPTRLASVEIMLGRTAPPPDAAQELYEALWLRRTDRAPFRYLPVPPPILVEMEVAAARERGWLRTLSRAESRQLRRAAARASRQLGGVLSGLLKVDPATYGPIPANTGAPPTRPELWQPNEVARFERNSQFMALATDDDRPLDWLRAGEALQHALLNGTRYSMTVIGGRSTPYRSQLEYGPLDPHLLRPRHRVPDGYAVEASFLTQQSELTDLIELTERAARLLPQASPADWRSLNWADRIQFLQQAGLLSPGQAARLRSLGMVGINRWPRWPWRSNYVEVPQVFIRVGYAPAWRTEASGAPLVRPADTVPHHS